MVCTKRKSRELDISCFLGLKIIDRTNKLLEINNYRTFLLRRCLCLDRKEGK